MHVFKSNLSSWGSLRKNKIVKGHNFYVTMIKKSTSFCVWKGSSFYLKQLKKHYLWNTENIYCNARLGVVFLENSSCLRRSTYQTILCALRFGTWFKLLTLIPLVHSFSLQLNLNGGTIELMPECIYHTSDIFFEEGKGKSENFVKLGRNNENNFNFIAISMKLWSSKKIWFLPFALAVGFLAVEWRISSSFGIMICGIPFDFGK